jgi:hypothetical protein
MPAPQMKIDENKLRRKMEQYERIVGKEVRQLVHNSARLCAVELARYTFPNGLGSSAKKQGEKKITKNIRSIFTIVNPQWWKLIISGEAFRSGGAAFNEKSGNIWAVDTQETIANIASAKAWHKSKRGSNGQAKPLRMLDRAIIKQAVYRKIIRDTEKKVGLAKAGWGLAAAACKADVREPLRGIPSWVRRNTVRAKGTIDDRKASGLGWKVKIKNQVGYARQTLARGNEGFAVNLARRKFFSMLNHSIRYVKAKEAGLR